MKTRTEPAPPSDPPQMAPSLVLAGLLGLLSLGLTGCTQGVAALDDSAGAMPPTRFSQTFTVAPGDTLVMEVDRGAIEVVPGPADRVEIEVTRQVRRASEKKTRQILEAHQVTFAQEGREVKVRAHLDSKWRQWRSWGSGLQVRYTVTVPRPLHLQLQTAGGPITVPAIQGRVTLATAGGPLKVGAIEGPLTCRTAGGSITIESATERIEARTSGGHVTVGSARAETRLFTAGGSIRLEECRGPLMAQTSGGNIEIRQAHAALEASTSGGSITVTLAPDHTGECQLSTSGGHVRLGIPEEFNAQLDARTSGGHVQTDVPILVEGTLKRSELVGKIGEGGRLVRLRTSGGNIHLSRKGG